MSPDRQGLGEDEPGGEVAARLVGNLALSGFDPALAEFPTTVARRTELIDLLQVTHLPERIAEYREAMLRGERFPPIAVVRVAGRLFVADGHKRLAACADLGAPSLIVEVWTVRRWLRDQGSQLARKSRQHWRIATRLPFDREARAQSRRLFWDTLGHWRRVGRSLALLRQTQSESGTTDEHSAGYARNPTRE